MKVIQGLLAVLTTSFVTTAYAETSIVGVIVARLGFGGSLCFFGSLLLMLATHVLFVQRNSFAGLAVYFAVLLTSAMATAVLMSGVSVPLSLVVCIAAAVVVFALLQYYGIGKRSEKMFVVACKAYYVCMGLVPFIVYFRI